jgi:maltose/moltooligosaccharide transporter
VQKVDEISILWIAAPVTGLIIQPIIGYFSDRTWTKLGRRRPYFWLVLIFIALHIYYAQFCLLWIAAEPCG